MIKLIAIKIDGHSKTEYHNKPFRGSYILSYKNDNKLYTYAYDDCLEMAEELESKYNYSDNYMIFKIVNNKIVDVETVSSFEKLQDYKNYYVLHNGFFPVSDYITLLRNL